MKIKIIFFLSIIILLFTNILYARDYKINVEGNQYIDQEVVISLINNLPEKLDKIDKGKIISELYKTGYFETIEIYSKNNILNINLKEYPIFNDVFFKKNKRFKKDQLLKIFLDNNEFNIFNEFNINKTINQYKDLYKSFGYNSINVDYEIITNQSDEVDIYFNFSEGKISKIRKIYFNGNDYFTKNQLLNQIKSKERNYLKFVFTSNFKINILNDDLMRLINFYQNNGFRNVNVDLKYEFNPKNNFFDVYFNISEGSKFFIKDISLNSNVEFFNTDQLQKLNQIIEKNNKKLSKEYLVYDEKYLNSIKKKLSNFIFNEGLYFFEILLLEKVENDLVAIRFDINSVPPSYVTTIDIIGNSRTKDSVVRRELEFSEGDAINDIIISKSNKKINNLGIFSSAIIQDNDDGSVIVKVEEKSTGTFQVGLGFNSYDGATFIAQLSENNFQGSGKKVNLKFNNSNSRSEYKIGVIDPYVFNKDLDLIYNVNYNQIDLSNSSSYNYDSFNSEIGVSYYIKDNISHRATLGYSLKDYEITNESNVSSSVLNLSGANAEFLVNNIITYNQLDSLIKPTNGNFVKFANVFSPVTNSTNGFTKNTLNLRKYYSTSNNIYSFQSLIGNILSLQDENIDNSDKFSLGGRWLRGFDNYGAGPRDSASSYIGGNNLIVTKLDLLRPIDRFSDNPIYLNVFTDVGKVWSNKTTPNYNNEGVRASYGFGFNYYSPIGPIGFSWGFPLVDESEDIKRMFTFSIGYLN